MKRRSFPGTASAVALSFSLGTVALAQDAAFIIALVPGLTTDAFYITMQKGAQAAADALGVELVFQGAPDFNPVTQVPVLDAVIARAPDAGILVTTVDRFIGTGGYLTGAGDADFPLAYIASDNVLGGPEVAKCIHSD